MILLFCRACGTLLQLSDVFDRCECGLCGGCYIYRTTREFEDINLTSQIVVVSDNNTNVEIVCLDNNFLIDKNRISDRTWKLQPKSKGVLFMSFEEYNAIKTMKL